jgi:hypothetical protein
MTMDEAIANGLEAAAALNAADYDTTAPLAAAFRRALAEAGYCVVPREPTTKMVVAGAKTKGGMELLKAASFAELRGHIADINSDDPAFQQIYRAMIAAAENGK